MVVSGEAICASIIGGACGDSGGLKRSFRTGGWATACAHGRLEALAEQEERIRARRRCDPFLKIRTPIPWTLRSHPFFWISTPIRSPGLP